MQPLDSVLFIKSLDCLYLLNFFSLIIRGDHHVDYERKIKFSLHRWQNFYPSLMATLRNKKKLAAVSRETPESTRSGRAQSILYLELTQDYISHVSEEIEGRVTKKTLKGI